MTGEIELMRPDIHEPNDPVPIYHEGRGASDVVRINSKSMVYTVTLDNVSIFVRQQRKRNIMAIGVLSYLAGPLTDNADDYGLECRVFFQMFLQTRQLAAAVGSPRSPKEHQHNVLFTHKRFKVHMFLMNRPQRKRRRGIPNLERFVSSWHNQSIGNLRRPHWLGKALDELV